MARVITHKALDKMVHYKTGNWRFFGGVDHRNVSYIIEKLTERGTEFKHYYVTTSIKGLYDHVVIVRREK